MSVRECVRARVLSRRERAAVHRARACTPRPTGSARRAARSALFGVRQERLSDCCAVRAEVLGPLRLTQEG